jgi:hypothetical protein
VSALDALRRYARRPAPPPAEERCELCAAPAGEGHRHVVELATGALRCACSTCATLFVRPAAGARFRTVPRRVLVDPGLAIGAEDWARLQIPVGLAFVVFSAAARRWIAHYPSPAGATGSELPLDAWRELEARSALVAQAEPDVEALLVRGERGAATLECFLAPIDLCYDLVGRIRRHWRGLDGGDAARREVAAFFDALRARARPLRPAAAGAGAAGGARPGAPRGEPPGGPP